MKRQNLEIPAWFWTGPNGIEPGRACQPTLERGEVLLQVKAVGVCGTDLGIIAGKNPHARPPLPLGHEIAGVVVACDRYVTRFQPGDRVFPDPYIGCGTCDACRLGKKTYCTGGGKHLGIHIPGGWQEFLAVPERNLYPIPENLGFLEASQAETVYTVMSGIKRLRVEVGSPALVIGDGPTGLLFTRLLQLAGCTQVTVAGHHPSRLELARKWGAVRAIYTHEEPLEIALAGQLFDVTVDTVGSQLAIQQVVQYAAPGGQAILFGLPPGGKPLLVDIATAVMREISLLGATDNPAVWPAVMNILSSGFLDIREMITSVYRFEDLPQALEAAGSKNAVKILLEWGGRN